jgi:hypothetical protein
MLIKESVPFFELIPLLIALKPRFRQVQIPLQFIVLIGKLLDAISPGSIIPRFCMLIPSQALLNLPVDETLF